MKATTSFVLITIAALIVGGCVVCSLIGAESRARLAVIHAESVTLAELEATKRQEMVINAKLQIYVNELNAPTEAERPSVWRQ